MKNKAKLKQMGLEGKDRYYYHRFWPPEKPGGIATICVIQTTERIYVRGISCCNCLAGDQFNKHYGRTLALGRAVKAMEKRESTEPIPTNLPVTMLSLAGWKFLSDFDVVPTTHEFNITAVKLEAE